MFYSNGPNYYFKILCRPYMRGHVESRYTPDGTGRMKFTSGGNVLTGRGATKGESGQPWKGFNPSAKDRHWAVPGFLAEQMPDGFGDLGVLAKLDALYEAGLIDIVEGAAWPTPVRYLDGSAGAPVQDIWACQPYTEGTVYGTKEPIDADVKWLGPTDPERLGYQTQKPLGLLDRIIQSSCPADGLVLDPFCGCGTTVASAQRLGRRWIGIDITSLAITLIKKRLTDTYGEDVKATYQTIGEPVSLPDAEALAAEDKYQFQWWALGLVDARPTEGKKGADRGVDGRIYFHESLGGETKQIVLSVKGGHVDVTDIRELDSVVKREGAVIGVLITLNEPTRPMRKEAADGEFYVSPWGKHPRLQILTIEQLLNGQRIDRPPAMTSATFKRAPKAKPARSAVQPRLLDREAEDEEEAE